MATDQASTNIQGVTGNTTSSNAVFSSSPTANGHATSSNAVFSPSPTANGEQDCRSTLWLGVCFVETFIVISLLLVITFMGVKLKRQKATREGHLREAYYCNKENEGKESSSFGNNDQPMELEEVDENLIPAGDIMFQNCLNGPGMIKYHKIFLTSKRKVAVAKRTSATAPYMLAKFYEYDIKRIIKLPENVYIVKVLGWCKSEPTFLINEYVEGKSLREHVLSRVNVIHDYDNTVNRKYQENAIAFASQMKRMNLQVARGIAFLTTNGFVHPGLRAEKVLVNSKGVCKVYSFFTVEKAQEILELIWTENVPYQWMSPEYLLDGKVLPEGDVWSFGVLLWEVYSYGKIPYDNMQRRAVEKAICENNYPPKPFSCNTCMWHLILDCWRIPSERPTMKAVIDTLMEMSDDNTTYDEIDGYSTYLHDSIA